MILLLSNTLDKSSVLISSWLERLGASFLFLSEVDLYQECSLDIARNVLCVGGVDYSLEEFNSVWIRRPFSFHMTELYQHLQGQIDIDLGILLREEVATITRYLYTFLSMHSPYFLGNPSWHGTNKLVELKMAQEVGLNTPLMLVTTQKQDVVALVDRVGSIISKSLYNSRVIHPWDRSYEMYTHLVTREDLSALPDNFAPSLIQEAVAKEYDIRTFFLDGELFSMAIVPDPSTEEVDFRRLETEQMKLLPIQLGDTISAKIRSFMERMGLKVGSLDLIKSTDGTIYFIEVNHEGIFSMVDGPCNYGIHKLIAEKLIEHDKR